MSAKLGSASGLKRVLIPTVAMATFASLMACSPAKWKENGPRPQQVVVTAAKTGDAVSEQQKAPVPLNNIVVGKPAVVVPEQLPTRKKPTDDNLDTSDITYEKGETVIPTGPAVDGMVPVVSADNQQPPQGPRYVPQEYLASEPVPPTPRQVASGKFFVIQNIATQKLRVYERCEAKNCPHKLILETEMVAGEDTPDHRSLLGSFRITEWLKFYEDGGHLFPSYYNSAYPALPGAGADLLAWTSKSLLPQGRGITRGAFGWYTAKIGPDPTDEQWMHGTWGRAADGDKFIRALQVAPANHNPSLASHGCTRVENQAIAFMREILPIDTPVIKVYAMEKFSDNQQVANEQSVAQPFNWIVTKNRIDKSMPSKESILEQGQFIPNTVPHAYNFGEEMSNLYSVPAEAMQGYLVVDEGRLVNYAHPIGLKVGGNKPYNYIPTMALSGPMHVRTQTGTVLHPVRLPKRHGPRRPLRPVVLPLQPIKVLPQVRKPLRRHKPILKPVVIVRPVVKPLPHPRPLPLVPVVVKKPLHKPEGKPGVLKPSVNHPVPPAPISGGNVVHKPVQKPASKPQKPSSSSTDHVTVQKPPAVPVDHSADHAAGHSVDHATPQKPEVKTPAPPPVPSTKPATGSKPGEVPASVYEP